MPQLESYSIIQLDDSITVNYITEPGSSSIDYDAYCKKISDNHKSRDSLDQDKRISSEIFFACGNCCGPLIQYAMCRICKKTDLRICLKCDNVKTFGDHRNCLRAVLLDIKKIIRKKDKYI